MLVGLPGFARDICSVIALHSRDTFLNLMLGYFELFTPITTRGVGWRLKQCVDFLVSS